ncbi:hypothetical protein COOONC_00148 [Cooperia oncophora]
MQVRHPPYNSFQHHSPSAFVCLNACLGMTTAQAPTKDGTPQIALPRIILILKDQLATKEQPHIRNRCLTIKKLSDGKAPPQYGEHSVSRTTEFALLRYHPYERTQPSFIGETIPRPLSTQSSNTPTPIVEQGKIANVNYQANLPLETGPAIEAADKVVSAGSARLMIIPLKTHGFIAQFPRALIAQRQQQTVYDLHSFVDASLLAFRIGVRLINFVLKEPKIQTKTITLYRVSLVDLHWATIKREKWHLR